MNSFEMNKVLGAVLGTCLGVVALNIASGAVFTPGKMEKPGYDIPVPQKGPAGGEPKQPQQPEVPLGELLAKADVGRGQSSAQKCAICHTFDKGGKNLVGPNLWNIVGRPRASEQGFNYSPAMKAKGGNWTIADLNDFVMNPKGFVPGTAMTFAGIPRGSERADVLAFLNSLADNPQPLTKGAQGPASPTATQHASR
jgi:cytochrome c